MAPPPPPPGRPPRTPPRTARGRPDARDAGRYTSDYQLVFACQATGALSVTPEVNLVRNVGFGDGATRTTRRNRFAEMPTAPKPFPLRHPPFVVRHREADEETENAQHLAPVLPVRLLRAWWKVRRRLGGGPAAP